VYSVSVYLSVRVFSVLTKLSAATIVKLNMHYLRRKSYYLSKVMHYYGFMGINVILWEI